MLDRVTHLLTIVLVLLCSTILAADSEVVFVYDSPVSSAEINSTISKIKILSNSKVNVHLMRLSSESQNTMPFNKTLPLPYYFEEDVDCTLDICIALKDYLASVGQPHTFVLLNENKLECRINGNIYVKRSIEDIARELEVFIGSNSGRKNNPKIVIYFLGDISRYKPNVALSSETIVEGTATTLKATSNFQGGKYEWFPLLGTGNSINVSPKITTNYKVIHEVKGCKSDTAYGVITVTPKPEVICTNFSPVELYQPQEDAYEYLEYQNYLDEFIIYPTNDQIYYILRFDSVCSPTQLSVYLTDPSTGLRIQPALIQDKLENLSTLASGYGFTMKGYFTVVIPTSRFLYNPDAADRSRFKYVANKLYRMEVIADWSNRSVSKSSPVYDVVFNVCPKFGYAK